MSASHRCQARGYTRARYLAVIVLSFAWTTSHTAATSAVDRMVAPSTRLRRQNACPDWP